MKVILFLLLLGVLVTSTTTIQADSSPFESAFKLLSSLISKVYQSYLYIKTTYPLNTLAVILLSAYFIFIVLKYIKRGVSGLFNNEIVYNYQPRLDSKNVGDQIVGVQKDLKQMGKYFRTGKKPGAVSQSSSNSSNQSLVEQKLNQLCLNGLIEQIQQKNEINQRIQRQIKTGFQQIIGTLKQINKK